MTTPVQATSAVIASTASLGSELGQTLAELPTLLPTPVPTAEARRLVSGEPSAGPVLRPPWGSSCGLMRAANAMCWGVRDLSRMTFDEANRTARAAKEDKFIWHGVRYIVKAHVRSSGLTLEEQLARNGVTDDQYNRAYVPGLSERMFERVTPATYGHIGTARNAYQGRDDGARNMLLQGKWPTASWDKFSPKPRLDAWAIYLGLPQRHGTFRVSPYVPAGEQRGATEHLSFTDHAMDDVLVDFALKKLPGELDDRSSTPASSSRGKRAQTIAADDVDSGPNDTGNKVLGHFLLERRRDERGHYVAYTYNWQLSPMAGLPVIGMFIRAFSVPTIEASDVAGVGRPFSIYGRVYYDPATGRRLDPQP